MRTEDDTKILEATRSDVQGACDLLRAPSPAALDRCSAALETAISRMASWRAGGRGATVHPSAFEEAVQLRAALRRAASLLGGAADYHARWGRILAAMTAGYDAGGVPAPAPRGRRVCMRG
ncbi:MAG: hypothetical protein ABSC23_10875 [Bryobacteraceae bacterium]|jgi:hypothetical protein